MIALVFEKRQYQEDCIELINNLESGSYLIQMATGLGKTYVFSRINRKGRMLILSHKEELVKQPAKFFSCSFGYELNELHSHGEDVVSGTTQTLTANKRYRKFKSNEFDIIVVDEAHHSAAKTYRELIEYFKPRLLLGFTATPNRGDGVRLDDIYSDIIFKKDIKWGIENHYLSDVECIRVNSDYDLSKVGTYMGDYKLADLKRELRNSDGKIIEAYKKYAVGATLIFTVSVEQAVRLQKSIPNSVVVTAKTPNREEIIDKFCKREIDCIINCMIFTEGTDIPLCETVIIARPTKSNALYVQMVGRGLRKHKEKKKLRLIDCVGVTADHRLCTAPSLLGIDMSVLDEKQQEKIQGDLLSLPDKVLKASDCPASWIKSVEYVELWAKENEYNLHNIKWNQLPDGTLTLSIPKNEKKGRPYRKDFRLSPPDELGFTYINGSKIKLQVALDMVYNILMNNYRDCEKLWNTQRAISTWGNAKATDKQKAMIKRSDENLSGIDFSHLTKFEASLIIDRIIENSRKHNNSHNSIMENSDLLEQLSNKYKVKSNSEKSSKNSEDYNSDIKCRSIQEYILKEYPSLDNEHNRDMLDLMYGAIPIEMLNEDSVYYSLINTEEKRIKDYGKSRAYYFCDIYGVIREYSRMAYRLAIKHLQTKEKQECSKALLYVIYKTRDKLPSDEREELKEEFNKIILDLRFAGGDHSEASNRINEIIGYKS